MKRTSYVNHIREDGQYPDDKVQIDIKYVPTPCIRFPAYGCRYYQITAIDEYSRSRVLTIVREKSTYETAKFLSTLADAFGFKIRCIQVDNGREFANDDDVTDKISAFMRVCLEKEYELKRTRPYSPWQNGKVERSHREDEKIFYHGQVFYSEKELITKVAKHQRRWNKTAKRVLNFRSRDQVVADFFAL